MANRRGRKSLLALKTQAVFESLREQAAIGSSPSQLELMIDHNLSGSSLVLILRKLEFDGRIVRRCGRGNVRSEYIIKEAQDEP